MATVGFKGLIWTKTGK